MIIEVNIGHFSIGRLSSYKTENGIEWTACALCHGKIKEYQIKNGLTFNQAKNFVLQYLPSEARQSVDFCEIKEI